MPHDDEDVPDDAYVVRYINAMWLVPDDIRQDQRRLSSAAFSPSSKSHDHYQGMSVDLLEQMRMAGISPVDKKGAKFEAIVRLRVGSIRTMGLRVGTDPRHENPFHAAVWGIKKGRTKKQLLKLCEWLDKPDDVIA